MTNSSALKVGGLRKFRQQSVICRMLNGGLTIYPEFIDVRSVLTHACVDTWCDEERPSSRLVAG